MSQKIPFVYRHADGLKSFLEWLVTFIVVNIVAECAVWLATTRHLTPYDAVWHIFLLLVAASATGTFQRYWSSIFGASGVNIPDVTKIYASVGSMAESKDRLTGDGTAIIIESAPTPVSSMVFFYTPEIKTLHPFRAIPLVFTSILTFATYSSNSVIHGIATAAWVIAWIVVLVVCVAMGVISLRT